MASDQPANCSKGQCQRSWLTWRVGVICHMDDVLIHAENETIHDDIVRRVLQKLQDAGLTLNEKCEFRKPSVKFLGHIIDGDGIRADPDKIKAITDFPPPTNITELQRFLGMTNQLAKFMPNLAEINTPLRQLLRKKHNLVVGRCTTNCVPEN